jgi:hypothetical protein
MLKSISKLGTTLSKKAQSNIKGGNIPYTPEQCNFCRGEWVGLCVLPFDSPCGRF